ncbi:MAG: HAMP domain-containing histidine kinase [Roseiflexaceae bacterium]|nr:HAMP domain-containing histidine kinase [Roseiflexaceae bacterium]
METPIEPAQRHAWPGQALLWSATTRRAGVEALVFVALPMIVLFAIAQWYDIQAVRGSVALGEGAALLLALRLQLPHGERQQQITAEALVAVVLAMSMGVLYAVLVLENVWSAGIGFGMFSLNELLISPVLSVGLPFLHGLSYGAFRVVFALLRWWNTLRQRRLLWALTHDQLVVVLVLMVVFGIGAALVALASGFQEGVANGTLVQQLVDLSLVGTFYGALIVLMLVGTLPLALLLSLVLVQRIVRRVEQLAEATAALRRGDYAARVVVDGQDEIAQLQTNFNAMAADLNGTLRQLHDERDRVARLLQAQRELTASVSHELRTPVATQRSYLDAMLHDQNDLPEHLRAELGVVERETHRLQRLIDDLFLLSRAEIGRLTLRMEPTDVGLVVERVAATLAPVGWQHGRVAVAAQTLRHPTIALADEERVEQVVRNLVHNGIRHTPPGGIVAIVVSEDVDHIQVQVNDTGSGIAPDDLLHIWNRFFRADAARALDQSGAGLGLALVKELTEAMGGSVAVESSIGAGSSFTLRLPRAKNQQPMTSV